MEIEETDDFVSAAVARIVEASLEARGGPFRLSLCGGGTPKAIYAALAEEQLAWENFIITFGDERCVPPDHTDSNFRMAKEALLDRVPIPESNVLRLKGEMEPAAAAAECESNLRARSGDEVFAHDLLLLGMGEDGHTASLFPSSDALAERERWVVANPVPQLGAGTTRLTFTFPLINAARRVLFLVTGEKKRSIVDEIRRGAGSYPAAGVRPENGTLTWLVG